jgi:hypothetical protein
MMNTDFSTHRREDAEVLHEADDRQQILIKLRFFNTIADEAPPTGFKKWLELP